MARNIYTGKILSSHFSVSYFIRFTTNFKIPSNISRLA